MTATNLHAKPDYIRHRKNLPDAADSTNLVTLRSPDAIPVGGGGAVATPRRDIIDCAGFKSVSFYPVFNGGTSPTVDVDVLEDVEENGVKVFRQLGSTISGAADGVVQTIEVNGARIFLRVDAVSGTPTSFEFWIAGADRLDHERGSARAI